jgi:hypothetical protein
MPNTKTKIYDGVTFDMSTGDVISHGKVSYVDSSTVAYTKGGDTTQTTTMDPRLTDAASGMLTAAQQAYESGSLGGIAELNPLAQQAINQAGGVASAQDQLAANMMAQANQGIDLSGMKTKYSLEAQQALGGNAMGAAATGTMGGSRERFSQAGIQNQLAAQFAGVDQTAAQQNMAFNQAAQQAQTAGLTTLGQVGQAQQAYNQQVADAPGKALQQYAGAFGEAGSGFGKTITETGGK